MPNEVKETENKREAALSSSLNNAAAIITKDYLEKLERYEIVNPFHGDIDIDIAGCGKFYKLSKLVMNSEENFLNKLTTIVNVASSIGCSIATIIKSDGYKIDFYIGILSKNARGRTETDVKRRMADAAAFRGALLGNMVGSELEEMSGEEVDAFKKMTLSKEGSCYSSVSGIVALRDEEEKGMKGYVQGLENLVDSLKDQKYTVVMLADPVESSEIRIIKQGYELLHTQLASFARSTVTINESDTVSLSKARTEGISEGISKSITMTQTRTRSKGKSYGGSVGVGGGLPFGILTANIGFNAGVNSSVSDTEGKSDGQTKSSQRNRSATDTTSSSRTAGKSLQMTYENRSVKSLLDKIDSHLHRLDECESFGAFDCAAYVIADDRETALTVASNYNALMRGQNSSVQASHINSWHKPEDTRILGKYMGALVHPRFIQSREEKIIVTPASMVSGNELALQIGLPKKSVSGITVIPMAPFGRNVMESTKDTLELGSLYHMGHNEGDGGREQKVKIDVESLTMHTFITGSTGKGKSTAIYALLDKLIRREVKGQEKKIKFLVIEPAKGEYKERFGSYPEVSVYGTNDKKTPLLRINPFSFPEDIHVLEHIDRLIEIFNVCWPMYAAMPAVLKDAVERAYIVSGWSLETSKCRYQNGKGRPLFPSFLDVLGQINAVMDESAYSSDSKGDYKGALCTRLKSLTNGLYGRIFTANEVSSEELFDRNVIVDLSRTGSSETKALIMGLLVMKLQEHRMANARYGNEPLKHVTVLEEAHNILKRTSMEQVGSEANVMGKSVEMLANSIAEMRTYGEGFIIADQAPGLMDMSVIRNTNTKLIFGLPDLDDRECVGRAAGLNDEQIMELSRLKTFVAAVYQNNWLEPALCSIDAGFKETSGYRYRAGEEEEADKKRVLKYLLLPTKKRDELDDKYITELVDEVFKLEIPSEAKISFMKYTKATETAEIQRLRGRAAYYLFNSDTAFGLIKHKENNIDSWYRSMKEVLEPSIDQLSRLEQQKIMALLTRERAEFEDNKESRQLYERLMDYM